MQTLLKLTFHRFSTAPAVFSALCLLLAGGQTAQAQTGLSLVPTSLSGSTATFTVNLTGGTNLGAFDFNVMADPAYLSFVGTSPFISSAANPFDTPLADTLSSADDLRVTFGQFGAAIDNAGTVALGTFQVTLLQPLPAAGTALSFGPVGVPDAPTNGSEVYDADGNPVLSSVTGAVVSPAAVPEASSVISLGLLLLLGLGTFRVSRRRAASAADVLPE